jgi:hypothetical protein
MIEVADALEPKELGSMLDKVCVFLFWGVVGLRDGGVS